MDLQAQVWQMTGTPSRGASMLRTALSQSQYRDEPAYRRLEVFQTIARCEQQSSVWRQLMQTYWSLGAKGWITRLLPEWRRVDPEASVDIPPLVMQV